MLKKVTLNRKPDGTPIIIPREINEANLEQLIKRFIELADYNPFDGQLYISQFRHFHGGNWTNRILQAILLELHSPTIDLEITHSRNDLLPFFEHQFERHQKLNDIDFNYPGDLTRLPI